jgi:hypothetical protein
MRVLRVIVAVLVAATVVSAAAPPQQNPYLGRWNLTGTGDAASYVYWLEVTQQPDGTLTGMFLNRVGNPVRLGIVAIENGELLFRAGSVDRPSGPEYRAKIENGKLVGRHSLQSGRGRRGGADPAAPPPPERIVNWVGVRPPVWPEANANGRHTYGQPVALIDGVSFDAWGVQNANRPLGWSVEDGAITNVSGANNLVSKATFGDFKIEAEYKLAEGSNSGIYIRGRYELQILDDAANSGGRADLGHMAIYGRTAPRVKASKPAGEWQTMEAIVVANRVTVTLNGQRVHDNQVIEGITGGALDNNELAPGPILVQGDHRPVWIRKMVVTPITTAGK